MTSSHFGLPELAPSLRGYQRAWLSKDIIGGLAAGSVVIPQAMAYATIAGLPVQFGLYTCMVPMAVYALLGGSRALSVSTTSTVAVLTGSTLLAGGVAAGADDPQRALATLTLMVGLILIVARLLKAGSLIDNISEATLVGIKWGVGLTVAASQLPKLLGIPGDPSGENFFDHIDAVFDQIGDVSGVTVAFSAVTLVVLLALRRFAPRVPGALVAVIGGILAVALFGLDEHGLAVIAEVPKGLPKPVNPDFGLVDDMVGGAFAIAIMVILETLSVARTVRRRSEPEIDNDQELVANGLSCALGAFFRGMPSAGGFSQTAMNQASGARTQLSELVTVVLAVACALFLGGVLSDLPQATLGCMVMIAVLGLIKPSEMIRFWRLNRIEFWGALVTAISGLVLGLLPAVLIGILLTLLLVIVELDRIGVTELQPVADGSDLRPAGADTHPVEGLLVVRFDGPLYTANIRSVVRKVLAAVASRPDVRVLVLDGTAIARVSLTAVDEILDLERELDERGIALWFAGVPPTAMPAVRKLPRWDELVAAGRIHPTALSAAGAYSQMYR